MTKQLCDFGTNIHRGSCNECLLSKCRRALERVHDEFAIHKSVKTIRQFIFNFLDSTFPVRSTVLDVKIENKNDSEARFSLGEIQNLIDSGELILMKDYLMYKNGVSSLQQDAYLR